jgi:hypothetical protein
MIDDADGPNEAAEGIPEVFRLGFHQGYERWLGLIILALLRYGIDW